MDESENIDLPEVQPEAQTIAPPVAAVTPVADTAMATGTDDEPEMTIADKHSGDTLPDLNGDGQLTPDEAATLLGDTDNSGDK